MDEKTAKINRVLHMKEKGYSNVEIGNAIGLSESTVRMLLENNLPKKEEEK